MGAPRSSAWLAWAWHSQCANSWEWARRCLDHAADGTGVENEY
ncbi:hypothetical protein [Azospirillum argentinense]